jgi:hypothetical protein
MKPDEMLLDAVQQGLKIRYKHKEQVREGNSIHATNLIDFCPREYALCVLNKIMFNAPKPASFAQMTTYELGYKIEALVLGALKAALVLHEAQPFHINHTYFGYPIIGSPDAWVKLKATEGLYTLEIKSIKPEDFDVLAEPKVVHECQLSLYLWLADLCKTPGMQVDRGLILYVCKTQKQNPFKVFTVERNNNFISRILGQLEELKTFSKNKKLPDRICNSPQALMARRPCKCVEDCFTEKKGKKK